MASLENCPTCSNPTSENANVCPSCGEPLAVGWAGVIREQNEKTAKEEAPWLPSKAVVPKKNKRKLWLRPTALIIVVIVAIIMGLGQQEDISIAERQNRTQELETQVASVPASNFQKNIKLYSELAKLNPDNSRYVSKLAYYKNKLKIAVKIASIKKLEERKLHLADLRKNNPIAYLAEIESSPDYMSELKNLRPKAYEAKIVELKILVRQKAMAGSELELLDWSWGQESGFAIVNGQVKNISGRSLKNVTGVVTFQDATGEFITSSSALIEYNPILSGQTSPFKVMKTWNPAMKSGSIEFKYLMGGSLKVYKSE
ncbi:MAG: zinc ribbon domain-containing protein [Magnetovibrio sp.]|nr:zinc ribbon domain-containing protein [Magnetovibrio sp.]